MHSFHFSFKYAKIVCGFKIKSCFAQDFIGYLITYVPRFDTVIIGSLLEVSLNVPEVEVHIFKVTVADVTACKCYGHCTAEIS